MTSDALLGRSDEPAKLPGHGPLPPSWPAASSPTSPGSEARVWVRRLLTDPIDDSVATIDTRRADSTGPWRC